jgi:hypothetical protein
MQWADDATRGDCGQGGLERQGVISGPILSSGRSWRIAGHRLLALAVIDRAQAPAQSGGGCPEIPMAWRAVSLKNEVAGNRACQLADWLNATMQCKVGRARRTLTPPGTE